jgi:outer membrane protein
MKNKLVALLFILTAGFALNANAQDAKPLKIGYTNVSYLLSVMPESRQIESELKTHSTQLQNQLQAKAKTFEEAYAAYEKGASTMTAAIRAEKERELREMDAQIQEFQKNAESSLQNKQVKLLEPVTEKISKAIDDVAKENNYTYVFNSDAGLGTTQILLHAPEGDNITDLVLKKLNVSPAAANQNTVAPPANKPAATKSTTPAKKK